MRRKGSLWQSILRALGDEAPLMTGVGRIMLLVILNVCLLLGMMPVITGGAAWLAALITASRWMLSSSR